MSYLLYNQDGYKLADQGTLPGSDLTITDDIFGYRLFLEDATSEIMVVWVDERAGADGAQHTLRYGTDPNDLNLSETVSGTQIPSRPEYIYNAKLTGLTPDTLYNLRVDTGLEIADLTPHKTFPTTVPSGGLNFILTSDIHVTRPDGATTPSELNPIGAEDADALFLAGDLAGSFNETFGSSEGAVWIDLLKNFLPVIDLPIMHVPGNHDVGNHNWDGSTEVTPDSTYYRVFFPNTAEIEPLGKNYGACSFGDYFTLLGLDTHSENPESSRTFVSSTVGAVTSGVILPIHHSPIVRGDRNANDHELQDRFRNAWLRTFIESPYVYGSYAGHIHNRNLSVPLVLTETDPQTSDSFALLDASGNPDGWAVQGVGGYREFGQGYRGNRPNDPFWAIERNAGDLHYNLLTLTDETFAVEEKGSDGATLDTTSFTLETEDTVTRTGTVTRDGDTVAGADVVFITRADLLANATAQTTTDASGAYSAEIPSGEDMVGIAFEGDDGDSTPFTEEA